MSQGADIENLARMSVSTTTQQATSPLRTITSGLFERRNIETFSKILFVLFFFLAVVLLFANDNINIMNTLLGRSDTNSVLNHPSVNHNININTNINTNFNENSNVVKDKDRVKANDNTRPLPHAKSNHNTQNDNNNDSSGGSSDNNNPAQPHHFIPVYEVMPNYTVPLKLVTLEDRDLMEDLKTGLWGVKLKEFDSKHILPLSLRQILMR